MGQTVLVEQFGAVRHLVLHRPQRLNAFTEEMEDDLEAALTAAEADTGTAVVVLRGAGRSFSSGFDLDALTSSPNLGPTTAPDDARRNRQRVDRWLRLWALPVPVVAQVHGYCLGMANEVLAAADLVVCGESARIGMPEARQFALPPTLGLLPWRIGLQRTKELLYTGRLLDGHEAVRLGLAIDVVPDDELDARVAELANQIADAGRERLAVCKQAANQWWETAGLHAVARNGAEFHALYHQIAAP